MAIGYLVFIVLNFVYVIDSSVKEFRNSLENEFLYCCTFTNFLYKTEVELHVCLGDKLGRVDVCIPIVLVNNFSATKVIVCNFLY